jgi:hypothetical protein
MVMVAAVNVCRRSPAQSLPRSAGPSWREDFAVVLPATDAAGARRIAETIRCAVLACAIPHESGPAGVVSVSIGVASFVPLGANPRQMLFEAADCAQYLAKRSGRNRTEIAGPNDCGAKFHQPLTAACYDARESEDQNAPPSSPHGLWCAEPPAGGRVAAH